MQDHEVMEMMESLFGVLDGARLVRWEPDEGLFVWHDGDTFASIYGLDGRWAGELPIPIVPMPVDPGALLAVNQAIDHHLAECRGETATEPEK